jgi:hypothetical protein
MTDSGHTGRVEFLRQVTEILAGSAEAQLAYLRTLEVGPDELALQFDDAYIVLPLLRDEGLVSDEARWALDEVDAQLAAMSDGPPEMWDDEALTGAPEWARVRELARRAVELLPSA